MQVKHPSGLNAGYETRASSGRLVFLGVLWDMADKCRPWPCSLHAQPGGAWHSISPVPPRVSCKEAREVLDLHGVRSKKKVNSERYGELEWTCRLWKICFACISANDDLRCRCRAYWSSGFRNLTPCTLMIFCLRPGLSSLAIGGRCRRHAACCWARCFIEGFKYLEGRGSVIAFLFQIN